MGGRLARIDGGRAALLHEGAELGGADGAGRAGYERLEHLPQLGAAQRPLLHGSRTPSLEDHEGRDGLNVKRPGDARRLIDVDLDHLDLAFELARDGVDLGRDGLAGPAPRGGEVDQDREIAPQHVALELLLTDVGHAHAPGLTSRAERAPPRSRRPERDRVVPSFDPKANGQQKRR